MWNTTGTLAVEQGSRFINGTGTKWSDEEAGFAIIIDGAPDVLEIARISSDTQIELRAPLDRASEDGLSFRIMPTQGLELNIFTALVNATTVLKDISETKAIGLFDLWRAEPGNENGTPAEFLLTLVGAEGPSAYQAWLDAGNSGTEADFIDAITDGAVSASAANLASAITAREAAEAAQAVAETARQTALDAQQAAEAARDVASAEALDAGAEAAAAATSANDAMLSAIAAGARIYTSTANGIAGTVNGDTFLVPANGGFDLYENVSGTATFASRVKQPVFDSPTSLKTSPALINGQYVDVYGGYNGQRETFRIDTGSTATADEIGVIALTGVAGRAISTRTWTRTRAELFADPRSFDWTDVLTANGKRYFRSTAPEVATHDSSAWFQSGNGDYWLIEQGNGAVTFQGRVFPATAIGQFITDDGQRFTAADFVTPSMFGTLGVGNDRALVRAAWDFAAENEITCLMEDHRYDIAGLVNTRSNLRVLGGSSVMYVTEWPELGGFIDNVVPGDVAARVQQNIHLQRLTMDGSKLPIPRMDRAFPDQADNLLQDQSDFNGAFWNVTRATVSGTSVLAPDGFSTVQAFTENAGTGSKKIEATTAAALVQGTEYVFSAWVKANGRTNFTLVTHGAAFSALMFHDFDLATMTADVDTGAKADIRDGKNGWYHLTVIREADSNGTANFGLFLASSTGAESYTGDGTSGVYVWGAALNAAVENNSNLLGFARGASDVLVVDCLARYMRDGFGGGTGGGGFGVEQGGERIEFRTCVATDCYRAFRVAGIPGEFADAAGQSKKAVNIRLTDFTAIRCGTALLAHSIGHEGDDQSDLGIFDMVVDGLYIEDCGHWAWREFDFAANPLIPAQKTGAIVGAGAQNFALWRVRIKLNPGFPDNHTDFLGRTGYPPAGTNFIGAGLSGPIGAAAWLWGRNCLFHDVVIDGSVDAIHKCGRAITYGDLATVSPTDGATGTVEQVIMSSVRFTGSGAYDHVFDGQTGLDNAKMSVLINVVSDTAPTLGVVGPNGTGGLDNVVIEFTDHIGQKKSGSVTQWLAYGNTRPSGTEALFSLGGIELGGGVSTAGARSGVTYDHAAGIMRSSRDGIGAQFHYAFYDNTGYAGGIRTNNGTSALVTTSDARLKRGFKDFDALEMLQMLTMYEFERVSNGQRDWGGIAQEICKVFPQAVVVGDSQEEWDAKAPADRVPWTVDYAFFIPWLLRAVQQMNDASIASTAQIEARLIALEDQSKGGGA